jgi:hypothetical protein
MRSPGCPVVAAWQGVVSVCGHETAEAFGYYQRYVLEPLIEVLRIAFSPAKTGYYIKDIYRDLPHEVTTGLEELFKVADISEFKQKISQADELFERGARLINSTRQAHPRS